MKKENQISQRMNNHPLFNRFNPLKLWILPLLLIIFSFKGENNSLWYEPGVNHSFTSQNADNPNETITFNLIYDQLGNAIVSKTTSMGTANPKSHVFANWSSVQITSTNNLHFDYYNDPQFKWYIIYFKNENGFRVCNELGSGGSSGSSGDATVECDCDISNGNNPIPDCDVSALVSNQTMNIQCVVKQNCMACKKPRLVRGNSTISGTGETVDFLVFQARSATFQ